MPPSCLFRGIGLSILLILNLIDEAIAFNSVPPFAAKPCSDTCQIRKSCCWDCGSKPFMRSNVERVNHRRIHQSFSPCPASGGALSSSYLFRNGIVKRDMTRLATSKVLEENTKKKEVPSVRVLVEDTLKKNELDKEDRTIRQKHFDDSERFFIRERTLEEEKEIICQRDYNEAVLEDEKKPLVVSRSSSKDAKSEKVNEKGTTDPKNGAKETEPFENDKKRISSGVADKQQRLEEEKLDKKAHFIAEMEAEEEVQVEEEMRIRIAAETATEKAKLDAERRIRDAAKKAAEAARLVEERRMWIAADKAAKEAISVDSELAEEKREPVVLTEASVLGKKKAEESDSVTSVSRFEPIKTIESLLVPVNEESVQFTAGVVGAVTGFVFGGPTMGAISAAAANYCARTEGEISEIVQGVSTKTIEVYNYCVRFDAKHKVMDGAKRAIERSLEQIKKSESVNPSIVEAIEMALATTAANVQELNDDFDVLKSMNAVLGAMGDLIETAVAKVGQINEKYNVQEQLTKAAQNALSKAMSSDNKPAWVTYLN